MKQDEPMVGQSVGSSTPAIARGVLVTAANYLRAQVPSEFPQTDHVWPDQRKVAGNRSEVTPSLTHIEFVPVQAT
jgi:hypothetical protein